MWGMPIEWSSTQDPVPVFVERFILPIEGTGHEVYLFGARYELVDVLVGGESYGDGHFVEHFVAQESSPGRWTLDRLVQRESPTYSAAAEADDYVHAKTIRDPSSLSFRHAPRWKPTDALWPTRLGTPMQFVGQVALPENDVTRTVLTWDVSLFLFWLRVDGHDHFKLVEHDPQAQTAEEHYADEERRETE